MAAGGDRNVFLLTREVSAQPGAVEMRVQLGRLEADTTTLEEGFVGFRVGIRGSFDDYRDSAVRGYGLNAGLASDGRLFIAKPEESDPKVAAPFEQVELRLRAEPEGTAYRLVLEAYSGGEKAAEISRDDIPSDWIEGGLAPGLPLWGRRGKPLPRTAKSSSRTSAASRELSAAGPCVSGSTTGPSLDCGGNASLQAQTCPQQSPAMHPGCETEQVNQRQGE